MEGNISLLALDTFQEIETMESYVNFEKQYLREDREYAPIFDPLPPLSHFVTVCLDPLPLCHHQNSDKLWADNKPTFDANFRSHIC